MGWGVWHSLDIFMSRSPAVIWPRSQLSITGTQLLLSAPIFKLWISCSLYITLTCILVEHQPSPYIHTYQSGKQKKITNFGFSATWARPSKMGHHMQSLLRLAAIYSSAGPLRIYLCSLAFPPQRQWKNPSSSIQYIELSTLYHCDLHRLLLVTYSET